MAKTRGLEARLNHLKSLRHEKTSPELIAQLRVALADSSNFVVGEAAEIIGSRLLAETAEDLVAAFDRFMIDPEDTDKTCRAKTIIVETLNKLEYDKADIFLRGIRHVQREPVWGGSADTAVALRSNSAFGLVRVNYRHVVTLLADLLADKEKGARAAAAQALGETGSPAAMPLLRYKARIGDDDTGVTAECLSALVRLDPFESLEFVTTFLDANDVAIQEGAAFAIAEARSPEALRILTEFWPRTQRTPLEEAILLSISMLRMPAALDFVIERLEGKNAATSAAAISALSIHRHQDAIRQRVGAIVTKKNDPALTARFAKKFEVNS